MNEKITPNLRTCLIIAAITVFAAALRFYFLNSQPLWLDEAKSLDFASLPLREIWGVDTHPPLYYSLLHFWLGFGDSEFTLRSLSAIFGVFTIPLMYSLGKTIGGKRFGITAALLLAVSPYNIRYAQEARMYTLMTMGATLAMWSLAWLLGHPESASEKFKPISVGSRNVNGQTPRLHWKLPDAMPAWLGYVAGSLIALYSHNTAALFFISANLTVGVWIFFNPGNNRAFIRNWIYSQIAVLLAWSIYWPSLLRQTVNVFSDFWIPFPDVGLIKETIYELHLSTVFVQLEPIPQLILLALSALGLWNFRRENHWIIFSLTLIVTAPLLEILLSLIQPIFLSRTLIWTTIPFIILATAGIVRIKWRPAYALMLILVMAIYLSGDIHYYNHFKKQEWPQAARYVYDNSDTGDIIIHDPFFGKSPFNYYFRQYKREMKQYFFLWRFEPKHVSELEALLEEYHDVWLVSCFGGKSELLFNILHKRGKLINKKELNGIQLFLFQIHERFPQNPSTPGGQSFYRRVHPVEQSAFIRSAVLATARSKCASKESLARKLL